MNDQECEALRSACNTRFEALEAWTNRQNGSLQRIEQKIDDLIANRLERAAATADNLAYKIGVPLIMFGLGALVQALIRG